MTGYFTPYRCNMHMLPLRLKWPVTRKARFIIERESRSLTTSEIVDAILKEYRPEDKDRRNKVVATYSSTLGQHVKIDSDIFFRQKNDFGDYVY